MLYFIPAWYQQNNWCENEQNWYVRRVHSEFDDTVKQVQLFHRSGAYPYRILLLSFAPNFRHFLHRQGVYHAPYWSCFDAIQGVKRKKVRLLSFHDLNWPENIEFIYTPFVVVAMLNGEKYAQIEFGEDGNPIQVDMYKDGRRQRCNFYDDRGFVSSTIVYKDEQPVYQDYLAKKGIWKLRYFFNDQHVEINPKYPNYLLEDKDNELILPFSRLRYEGIDQVIGEVLTSYLNVMGQRGIFCVAMHQRHPGLLAEILKDRKLILSFFKDRYIVSHHPEAFKMIEAANYIIADSKENLQVIQEDIGEKLEHMKDITPFDSRVEFGISQRLSIQKILVPVDGITQETFRELIRCLGEYLPSNEKARVHFFTRQADYGRKAQLMQQTRDCLRSLGLEEAWAKEDQSGVAENNLDVGDIVPTLFFVEQCVDELSVSKCMREQRLIVDMRDTVELYLRITGISIGIPQIVSRETQFVEHGKNGFIIKDMDRLAGAIEYYLSSLQNWNEAMVYSYELGQKYTTNVLLKEWKEVIEFVEQNLYPSTGTGGLEQEV